MKREVFAEFDPNSWQEDGLLVQPPQPRSGWIGTRAAAMFGSVVLGAASLALASTPSSALCIERRAGGEAAMEAAWYEAFGPAVSSSAGAYDATPAGYWASLQRAVDAWPAATEIETESEAEPLL